MSPTLRVIAAVGMTREAKIIAGESVSVVIGGGDAAGLERKLDAELPRLGPGKEFLLLSFGVCGALSPALKAGDLVVGSGVVSGGRRWVADPDWSARLLKACPDARSAEVAAGDVMVGSTAEKRALFDSTRAAIVDMESHIVARVAERHGLRFGVLRAVSDAADHALPPAALAGLKPDGSPDILAVLRSLAGRPGQVVALIRTAQGAGAAFRTLENAAKALRPLA